MRGWRGLLLTGAVLGIAIVVGTAGSVPAAAETVSAVTADPGGSVDINVFFNALAPYGVWQQSSRWGWAWYPTTVPVDWRPYTRGHWVLTDDGWTWVSDFDWGWGPFHYGRWFDDPDLGWMWVPGAVWGPAWVMWEQGDDYIGWAPLPPEVGWSWSVGLDFGNIELESMLPPGAFVFVRDHDFVDRDLRRFIVPRARSVGILPRTHVVTRYEIENGRVIDRGIAPDFVEGKLGRPLPRYRVEGVEAPGRLGRGGRRAHGDVIFYRPHVREGERFEPPAERASSPLQHFEKFQRRQDEQRRELEQRHRDEQLQLERLQDQDRRHPPQGVRPEELQRRQEQERQFMQREQERENHQMEQRRAQERQRSGEQQRQHSTQQARGGDHGGGRGQGGEHHGGGGH